MKHYTLAGILAAGIATAAPEYAGALEVGLGGPCVRAPNSMCMAPLLAETYKKGDTIIHRARLIVEQYIDKDIYRVLLQEGDTLESALQILQREQPKATIDDLVKKNKLRDKKLPKPKRAIERNRSLNGSIIYGEVDYGSLTYTVKVTPATPTK